MNPDKGRAIIGLALSHALASLPGVPDVIWLLRRVVPHPSQFAALMDRVAQARAPD
jgi:hypothetical protein